MQTLVGVQLRTFLLGSSSANHYATVLLQSLFQHLNAKIHKERKKFERKHCKENFAWLTTNWWQPNLSHSSKRISKPFHVLCISIYSDVRYSFRWKASRSLFYPVHNTQSMSLLPHTSPYLLAK